MRAITLWQPWASAIALGHKKIETRGRRTLHRGPIAIHAAQVWGPVQRQAVEDLKHILGEVDYPRGVVVCVAELVDCVQMTDELMDPLTAQEYELGDWYPGRWAWYLENVRPLIEPFKLRGRQSMWTLGDDEAAAIESHL